MVEVKWIIEDAVRHSVAGVVERLLQGAALRCNPDGTLEEWERVRVQRTINDRLTVLGYPEIEVDAGHNFRMSREIRLNWRNS